MEFVRIANLPVANTTLQEAADFVLFLAKGAKTGNAVVTPNAEIAAMALEDPSFAELLQKAALSVPDGVGVVKASQIWGTPVKEKVAGIDLATKVMEKAPDYGVSVYLLGGKKENVRKAFLNLKERYPRLDLKGYSDGYFTSEEEAVEKVNASGADVIMCCLGAPKQERFMIENAEKFTAKVLMGVGGSVDVWAGAVKRAPKLYINLHLEWLYRLIKQPSRLKRIVKIPKYLKKIKDIKRKEK